MTIYGWDMSHYDAPSIGDAVSEGFVFITHKVGGDVLDDEIDAWWSSVKKLGADVLLGAYWVLYPGSPTSRADAFLARLDVTCPGWRSRPFILQVDCEKWNNNADTMPSKADIKTFCDRLVAKCPKLRPVVYAPKWVYGDKLTGLGYPLWESAYVSGAGVASKLYPGDNSSKWAAYSGQIPEILQFTSSATIAGQTTCDANAYRGTFAQLKALLAPGWTEDMPLARDDAMVVWNTDIVKAPDGSKNADGTPNVNWTPGSYLYWTYRAATQTRDAAQASLAVVQAIAARPDVDEVALAAALTGPVVAGIVAALPSGDQVSQAEVTAAVEAAFAKAFGPAVPSA
jgi:hypothetical protein